MRRKAPRFSAGDIRRGFQRCAVWRWFVSTIGGAPSSVIKQYIEDQKTSERKKTGHVISRKAEKD
jgi:REP element-mobilizing transposase RayT